MDDVLIGGVYPYVELVDQRGQLCQVLWVPPVERLPVSAAKLHAHHLCSGAVAQLLAIAKVSFQRRCPSHKHRKLPAA
jgi:hypothetical protein